MIQKTVCMGNYSRFLIIFPKHRMKILLDFNAKVERGNIFKVTTGNESPHQDCNDNGVRTVNFAT